MVPNHSKMVLLNVFDSLLHVLVMDLDEVGPFLGLHGRPGHGIHGHEVHGLLAGFGVVTLVTGPQIRAYKILLIS